MTNRYALIDAQGNVDNIVIWDGLPDWTPPQGYTTVQSDTAGIGWTYSSGAFSPPASAPLTAAQIAAAQVTANEAAIQAALDASAVTQGYADIKSACAYASSTVFTAATGATAAQIALVAQQELYRHQGNAAQQWMSLTWATAYAYVATVKAGTNPMPTPAQAVAMMPPMVWPTV